MQALFVAVVVSLWAWYLVFGLMDAGCACQSRCRRSFGENHSSQAQEFKPVVPIELDAEQAVTRPQNASETESKTDQADVSVTERVQNPRIVVRGSEQILLI